MTHIVPDTFFKCHLLILLIKTLTPTLTFEAYLKENFSTLHNYNNASYAFISNNAARTCLSFNSSRGVIRILPCALLCNVGIRKNVETGRKLYPSGCVVKLHLSIGKSYLFFKQLRCLFSRTFLSPPLSNVKYMQNRNAI